MCAETGPLMGPPCSPKRRPAAVGPRSAIGPDTTLTGVSWHAVGDGIGIVRFDGQTWSSTEGSLRLVAPDGTMRFASVNGSVESWDGV